MADVNGQVRDLEPMGRGVSKPPFPVDEGFMASLRPDQVPRYLGALTDPANQQRKTVQLADLTATQNRVATGKVKAIQDAGDQSASDKPPLVVRHNGKHYIADGHHRLTADWLSGKDQADVAFKDLEPVTQALKGLHKDGPSAGDVHVDAPLGDKRGTQPDHLDDGDVKIVKMDDSLGLVFGWAIVCKVDGKDYYDLNIDYDGPLAGQRVPEHIPETVMMKAACDFMQTSRPGNEMHDGPDAGSYVFAFPMTTDIAKAMGIETHQTGLMVAYKPPPSVYAKFKSGAYTGFSIEGSRLKTEEHA